METQFASKKRKETKPEATSLKGTFVAVLLIGAFIAVSWFVIFGLFINRA